MNTLSRALVLFVFFTLLPYYANAGYSYTVKNATDEEVSAVVNAKQIFCTSPEFMNLTVGETRSESSGIGPTCCGESIKLWAPAEPAAGVKQQVTTFGIFPCKKDHFFKIKTKLDEVGKKRYLITEE
jgi:hypothetical protein